jgi:hypothetical protein
VHFAAAPKQLEQNKWTFNSVPIILREFSVCATQIIYGRRQRANAMIKQERSPGQTGANSRTNKIQLARESNSRAVSQFLAHCRLIRQRGLHTGADENGGDALEYISVSHPQHWGWSLLVDTPKISAGRNSKRRRAHKTISE